MARAGGNVGVVRNAKKLRLERGLSQVEVAEATGLNRSHLSQFENGLVAIPLEHFVSLVELYDVKPRELLDPAPAGFKAVPRPRRDEVVVDGKRRRVTA